MAFAPNGTDGTVTYPHPSALDNLAQMSIAFVLNANSSFFYDTLIQCQGNDTSGTGNATGFAVLHNASDPTALFLAFRNNNTNPAKVTNTGAVTANTDTPAWVVFDGTQGVASDRVRLWLYGTEITTWSADTADHSASIGLNDQPLVLGSNGAGSLFSSTILSDVTLFIGRVITDQSIISAHANGYSAGHFVRSGDIWIPAVRDFNDRFGLVATSSGGVTVAPHPRIVMPSQSARTTRKIIATAAKSLIYSPTRAMQPLLAQ